MRAKKVVIIGAGAAGMAAAIRASQNGAQVTVIEHMDEPLKKLLITGNGRCNFSNTDISAKHYHGGTAVIESVIGSCSCDDLLDFMDSINVEALEVHYRFDENGYFYPSTNRAETVRGALLSKASELGAEILTDTSVCAIRKQSGGFIIDTVSSGKQKSLSADSIVFATGSNAAPKTGSDSSIYPVIRSLSIPFRTFMPALCGIKSDSPELRMLAGLRADCEAFLSDITVNEEYKADVGEIQFNEHTVSGLPAMQLSRYVPIGKKDGHGMKLFIKLLKANNRDFKLPLEEVILNVTGTEGFQKAVCCSGGIPCEVINPETLMYKDIPGIYFAGELIDVDGDCGGYNLHFAFASGLKAGSFASL